MHARQEEILWFRLARILKLSMGIGVLEIFHHFSMIYRSLSLISSTVRINYFVRCTPGTLREYFRSLAYISDRFCHLPKFIRGGRFSDGI